MQQVLRPTPPIYELKELIGQGSSGCVYRAVRTDAAGAISHEVAIKVLNSKNAVEGWSEEFKSLARVQSNRCVRVFGFEWLGQRPALVLELIRGVSLSELCRGQTVNLTVLQWLGQEIAAGLSDLNRVGLCHGDLSLNNVMVNTEGEVRLLDFGFGNGHGGRRRITRQFAAPEVLNGQASNQASDLWSLGQILRAILPIETSVPPWITDLLQDQPEKRAWRANPVSRPRELGLQIKNLLRRQRQQMGKTCEVGHPQGQSIRSIRWFRGHATRLAIVLLLLCSGGTTQVGRTAPLVGEAQLRFRSNYGVQIELNGRAIGFAPRDLTHLRPGRYVLTWILRGQRRQRTLTLRAGDHILIDDQVFSTL
ncbi:MAG: protein kinase [Bdellovibrionales bacterium]